MIKSLNQQRRVMSARLQDPTFTKKDGSVLNLTYEGGSESSVIGVITLLIYMIGCCIIP